MSTAAIDRPRERVAHLEQKLASATARANRFTGADPAVVSGVAGSKGFTPSRLAAYDEEAHIVTELRRARRDLAALERQAARTAREDADRAGVDHASIRPGGQVRTRHGWHKVVRVNAKTITVETPYSWTERIPHTAVLEVSP